MTVERIRLGGRTHEFADLRTLLARATPLRSGDVLAGIAASSAEERVAAQLCLAGLPLTRFLEEMVVPWEDDVVTRLILEQHDLGAFRPLSSMTVGELRDWLLDYGTDAAALTAAARGLAPEMVAAVSKLMGNQDLILVSAKCRVVASYRGTVGLPGRMSVRLQPNHPSDDLAGIAASIVDGLLHGCGDAMIGINPATDSLRRTRRGSRWRGSPACRAATDACGRRRTTETAPRRCGRCTSSPDGRRVVLHPHDLYRRRAIAVALVR